MIMLPLLGLWLLGVHLPPWIWTLAAVAYGYERATARPAAPRPAPVRPAPAAPPPMTWRQNVAGGTLAALGVLIMVLAARGWFN